jgi:hypothetical protein
VKKQINGSPLNLTGPTVTFHMTDKDGNLVIDAAGNVENPPTDGIVNYEWQVGNTSTAGKFDAEFFIENLPSGGDLRAPNNDQIEIIITENLA